MDKKEYVNRISLVIVLAVAVALNVLIAFRPVFSNDESYTIVLARNSFADTVRITKNDVHAPRALEYHYGYYDFIIEKWKRRQ